MREGAGGSMRKLVCLLGAFVTFSSFAKSFDCKVNTRVGDSRLAETLTIDSSTESPFPEQNRHFFKASNDKTLLVYIIETKFSTKPNTYELVAWYLDGEMDLIKDLYKTYQWQEYDKRTIIEAFDSAPVVDENQVLKTNFLSNINNFSISVKCQSK